MNVAEENKTEQAYGEGLKSQSFVHSLSVFDELKETRQSAFKRFQALDFPTKKMEGWKYINLEPLLKTALIPADAQSAAGAKEERVERCFFSKDEKNRLVFLNGIYSEKYSRVQNLPKGASVESLAAAFKREPQRLRPYLERDQKNESNAFAAINTFSFQDGVFVFVPKDTVVEDPIHLLFAGFGSEETSYVYYPRILVVLEDGAKADIIFNHTGMASGMSFMNSVSDIHLGRNARLHCFYLQKDTQDAYQFVTSRYHLAKGSRLDTFSFVQSEAVIREEMDVGLSGTDTFCSLKGLSLLSRDAKVFRHTTVNHKVPHTTSRQHFKNILGDKSQTEFDSLVHVWKDAVSSDSNQQDRNLLLSDSARAYSRPQLKIDNDDVKCNHGAATGQLVANELFYLRSRGIEEKDARFLLTLGFAEEMLTEIPVSPLREYLEKFVKEVLVEMLQKNRVTGFGGF